MYCWISNFLHWNILIYVLRMFDIASVNIGEQEMQKFIEKDWPDLNWLNLGY